MHISVYNVTCFIASLLGICGAVYQLFPKKLKRRMPSNELSHFKRQNYIICCLASADLLVLLGAYVLGVNKFSISCCRI